MAVTRTLRLAAGRPRCVTSPPTSWRSEMTWTTVAIAVAVIVFMLARRLEARR